MPVLSRYNCYVCPTDGPGIHSLPVRAHGRLITYAHLQEQDQRQWVFLVVSSVYVFFNFHLGATQYGILQVPCTLFVFAWFGPVIAVGGSHFFCCLIMIVSAASMCCASCALFLVWLYRPVRVGSDRACGWRWSLHLHCHVLFLDTVPCMG